MPNCKVPDPDFVQGFWLKHFEGEGLRRNLQKCLEMMWMTKGENNTNAERQRKGQGSK